MFYIYQSNNQQLSADIAKQASSNQIINRSQGPNLNTSILPISQEPDPNTSISSNLSHGSDSIADAIYVEEYTIGVDNSLIPVVSVPTITKREVLEFDIKNCLIAHPFGRAILKKYSISQDLDPRSQSKICSIISEYFLNFDHL